MSIRGQLPIKDALQLQNPSVASAAAGRAQAAAGFTPAVGLLVLAAVAVEIALFITLTFALGIAHSWVAFLFLLYWGGIEQMKFEKLPNCIVGALLGLALAYGIRTLPAFFGPAVWVLILGAILVLVYFAIMHWWPLVVNNATMLFLTVGTIPAVQAGAQVPSLLPAFGFGVAYFAALAWLAQLLVRRSAGKRVDRAGPANPI
jgi:hypothetical protein